MKNEIININKIITQRIVHCMATARKIKPGETCIKVDFEQEILFPEVLKKNLILSWHFIDEEIFIKWFKKARDISVNFLRKDIITTSELAKMFNVTPHTISGLARKNRLPKGIMGFRKGYYYPRNEAINKMKNRNGKSND